MRRLHTWAEMKAKIGFKCKGHQSLGDLVPNQVDDFHLCGAFWQHYHGNKILFWLGLK